MNIAALQEAGIDYESGVERFLEDEELYQDVLATFLEDTTLENARKALEENDFTAFFNSIHEIKGASGNTDMTALYKASSELTALLREKKALQEDVTKSFLRFEKIYIAAKDGIRKALEDS